MRSAAGAGVPSASLSYAVPRPAPDHLQNPWAIAVRVVTAAVGSYFASSGLAALGAVILAFATGIERSEAVMVNVLAAFLTYLIMAMWAFCERRLPVVVIAIWLGSIATHALAVFLVSLAGATA